MDLVFFLNNYCSFFHMTNTQNNFNCNNCKHLLVPPRITPFQFGDEPMNFGEPASIQCTIAGGDWPMKVNWQLNGYNLPEHLHIATTKFTRHTYALAIESVSAEHAGNYTCLAENWAGSAKYTDTLIVNGLKLCLIIFKFIFG